MIRVILAVILFFANIFSQTSTFNFHSSENIKLFADYLFCEADYLRAAEEYERISSLLMNDTINFKVMLCYSEMELYSRSNLKYNFAYNSELQHDVNKLYLKNIFMEEPESFYERLVSKKYPFQIEPIELSYMNKLTSMSNLFNSVNGITKDEILNPFSSRGKEFVSTFYEWKKDPPYKSPALAGIFSALIPGSGKMYVGEWGDGITAFLITGLFAFLAYDNFKADHTTRAWIFTGLGVFFYGGNIYGSVSSAQIFNARIDFEFNDGLNLFLEQENYFLPEYDFCE